MNNQAQDIKTLNKVLNSLKYPLQKKILRTIVRKIKDKELRMKYIWFLQQIEKENILISYVYNIINNREYSSSIDVLQRMLTRKEITYSSIIGLFRWALAKEGVIFWSKVHENFRIIQEI